MIQYFDDNKDCARNIYYSGLPNSISKNIKKICIVSSFTTNVSRNGYVGFDGSVKVISVDRVLIKNIKGKEIYSDVFPDGYNSKYLGRHLIRNGSRKQSFKFKYKIC
jgi:hypothetical protein